MSKSDLVRHLAKLNAKIDRLILQGKPYGKEAKEHKRVITILRSYAA